MKKFLIRPWVLAGLAAVALPVAQVNAQSHVTITNLLFSEEFSGYEPGTLPTTVAAGGKWATATWTGPGSCSVVEDGENVFGSGANNRYLKAQSTYALSLITPTFFSQDVLSFGFDYIGHYPAGDASRWLNVGLRIGTAYAHYTSIRNADAKIRTATNDVPATPAIGVLDAPYRVLTIMNNRATSISYDRPDGQGTAELDPIKATVWVYHYTGEQAGNWVHLIPQYLYVPTTTNAGTVLDNLQFILDSNVAGRSFDLDNIKIYGSRAPLPSVHASLTNLLFSENFSSYDPGTPPLTAENGGRWGTATWNGTNGSWAVLEDELNKFGFGAGNRFLQLSNTHNLNPGLITPLFEPQEVLSYAFDFIGHVYPEDGNRWLNVDARNATGAAHTTSLLMYSAQFRVSSGTYYYDFNDTPLRVLTIVNNREGPITYDRPDGLGTTNLGPVMATVWLKTYELGDSWRHAIPEYIYARGTGFPAGATIDRVRFFMDSNAVFRSFDMDNVEVYGSIAAPPAAIVLAATVAGGNIEIRWNGKAGQSYQVQSRAALGAGDWTNVGSIISPTADGEQLATDSISGASARFYRVQVVSP
jgi:hypothetical protein